MLLPVSFSWVMIKYFILVMMVMSMGIFTPPAMMFGSMSMWPLRPRPFMGAQWQHKRKQRVILLLVPMAVRSPILMSMVVYNAMQYMVLGIISILLSRLHCRVRQIAVLYSRFTTGYIILV